MPGSCESRDQSRARGGRGGELMVIETRRAGVWNRRCNVCYVLEVEDHVSSTINRPESR